MRMSRRYRLQTKSISSDFSGIIIIKGKTVSEHWSIDDKVNGMMVALYAIHGTASNFLILNPDKIETFGHIEPSLSSPRDKFNQFDLTAAWPMVFFIGASTQVANCMVQILKNHLNIKTLVGICNENSIEENRSLGFDHLVSYNNGKTLSNVHYFMETILGSKKFDVILDSCGSDDFLPVMNEFLKLREANSYYSKVLGDNCFSYTSSGTIQILKERLIIEPYRRFNLLRTYNYYWNMGLPNKKSFELANQLFSSGNFHPRIDSVYTFEDFQSAVTRLDNQKSKVRLSFKLKDHKTIDVCMCI
ncbi:zinc ion binding [Maudiozyma exigua]|uniref:Zinc ion binding n=1 Tax=Maudiozyma exigua TaxID=34358 RepID=A0A9P7B3E6_MAUEX|nr:zinc ion binding [Kazachstania exigua]